jgi:hypothetical protein
VPVNQQNKWLTNDPLSITAVRDFADMTVSPSSTLPSSFTDYYQQFNTTGQDQAAAAQGEAASVQDQSASDHDQAASAHDQAASAQDQAASTHDQAASATVSLFVSRVDPC